MTTYNFEDKEICSFASSTEPTCCQFTVNGKDPVMCFDCMTVEQKNEALKDIEDGIFASLREPNAV